jgi:hypothetical protein
MVNGNNKSLALGIVMSLLFLSMFGSFGVVSADDVTVTFSGITNPSSTHKAYQYTSGVTGDYNNTTRANEFTTAQYAYVTAINDASYYILWAQTTNYWPFMRFEFDIDDFCDNYNTSTSRISSIALKIQGFGKDSDGDGGIYLGILHKDGYAITSNVADISGTWSHAGVSDNNVSIAITSNVVDYVDGTGYLKVGVKGRQDIWSVSEYTGWLSVDYVTMTITYTPSLTTPTLTSPTNSDTDYNATPNFDWNASTGGTPPYTYELMVDDVLSFDSLHINQTGLTDSNFTCTPNLASDTLYYWKVRAKDACATYSSWSDVYSFSTAGFIAPSLVSPANSETGVSSTPDFDWDASTGGTAPLTYEIKVDDDILFLMPNVDVTSISDSNYSYSTGLTPATTYYWKVRAKDACATYSSWATTHSFTTASLTSPTFTLPTAGTAMTTATPTFSWSASTGGSGTYTYELQVSLLNTFATNVVDATGIATTSYTMTSNLTPDTYYARLRAKDSLNNYSAWTSTVSFTAVAPSSGGASSSSTTTSTQETYTPPTLTTDNDDDTTVTTTSGGSVTNIINKYIINPVRTIVLNPLKQLWDWVVGLFHGSSQETLIEPVAEEAESEFNRIVKDMSEDWDAFWSDVEIFIEDIKEVLGC